MRTHAQHTTRPLIKSSLEHDRQTSLLTYFAKGWPWGRGRAGTACAAINNYRGDLFEKNEIERRINEIGDNKIAKTTKLTNCFKMADLWSARFSWETRAREISYCSGRQRWHYIFVPSINVFWLRHLFFNVVDTCQCTSGGRKSTSITPIQT